MKTKKKSRSILDLAAFVHFFQARRPIAAAVVYCQSDCSSSIGVGVGVGVGSGSRTNSKQSDSL